MIEHTILPTVSAADIAEVRAMPPGYATDYFVSRQEHLSLILIDKETSRGCDETEARDILGFAYTAIDTAFQRDPGFFTDLERTPTLGVMSVAKQLASIPSLDAEGQPKTSVEAFLDQQKALEAALISECARRRLSGVEAALYISSCAILAEVVDLGLMDLWRHRYEAEPTDTT